MIRNSMNILCSFSATLLLIPLATLSAQAQQVTGTPGSPGATTSITGQQLPPPPARFGGVIKEKASESQDTRTGVALVEYRYDPPFKFTGKIDKLTFRLEPEQTVGASR